MALKTVFALLLVVCLAELAWSAPPPSHSIRATNGTVADATDATASSSSSDDSSNEGSSNNIMSGIEESIGNMFDNIFGKPSVDSSDSTDASSSPDVTTNNSDTSSDILDEDKDEMEGFFGHLFGKRDFKFETPDVFTTLYKEWANGRSSRSVTVRDTDSSFTMGDLFDELYKEWLKGNL